MTTKASQPKKAKKKTSKRKNPLYVVDEKSNVVEEAKGWLDLLLKKLNLEAFIQTLTQVIQMLLESVNSYPMFQAIKDFLDALISECESWVNGLVKKQSQNGAV